MQDEDEIAAFDKKYEWYFFILDFLFFSFIYF